jgi:fumarate hydratase subunit beta
MSREITLQTPLSDSDTTPLRIGDRVLLSGTVYTARDAAHKRLIDLMDSGKPLPFDLKGAVIYYVGPAPAPPGKPIGSAGPPRAIGWTPSHPALSRQA